MTSNSEKPALGLERDQARCNPLINHLNEQIFCFRILMSDVWFFTLSRMLSVLVTRGKLLRTCDGLVEEFLMLSALILVSQSNLKIISQLNN